MPIDLCQFSILVKMTTMHLENICETYIYFRRNFAVTDMTSFSNHTCSRSVFCTGKDDLPRLHGITFFWSVSFFRLSFGPTENLCPIRYSL